MGSERAPRPRYDERHKKLFGHKRMIDLLRAVVRAGRGVDACRGAPQSGTLPSFPDGP